MLGLADFLLLNSNQVLFFSLKKSILPQVYIGFTLYPEIFNIIHNDPAAHQDHCEICQIRTRDLCLRSLVH